MRQVMALFGEAEKGAFQVPHRLSALEQLVDCLGHPPASSEGIFFAVQALLYEREVLFFRVSQEGFSQAEYLQGLHYLQNPDQIDQLHALCLPGVGSQEILQATSPICQMHGTCLVMTEKDLYDYLTQGFQ